MELLDLLFALIERFVPVDKGQFVTMRNKAQAWRGLAQDGKGGTIGEWYMKIHEFWLVQMIITLSYMPLVNYIQARQTPVYDDVEDPRV